MPGLCVAGHCSCFASTLSLIFCCILRSCLHCAPALSFSDAFQAEEFCFSRATFSVENMATGVFFIVVSFLDFFSQFWVSPVSLPPILHSSASYYWFLYIFCRDVLAMPTWSQIAIWDIHPVFSLTTASVGARVFSRLAWSRKINLTAPSGSASWPISAICL